MPSGVVDVIGAGDSYIMNDFLPTELAEDVFEKLQSEVQWQTMHHRGGEVPRLVAVEGEVADDESFPVYRHPADESPPLRPFSPVVSIIRNYVEKILKHSVNHVLIQLYRNGGDYISEHSDKTIDVVRDSSIVNVSFGAQRTMRLRTKKDRLIHEPEPTPSNAQRTTQRLPLPHNSMFVMGLETNAKWLHGINHDNRPLNTKAPEEQVKCGARISLTFRHIGTFLNKEESLIWGQGAKHKTKEDAGPVVFDPNEVAKLISAFGNENQQSDFDWDNAYSTGFDVLHFTKG